MSCACSGDAYRMCSGCRQSRSVYSDCFFAYYALIDGTRSDLTAQLNQTVIYWLRESQAVRPARSTDFSVDSRRHPSSSSSLLPARAALTDLPVCFLRRAWRCLRLGQRRTALAGPGRQADHHQCGGAPAPQCRPYKRRQRRDLTSTFDVDRAAVLLQQQQPTLERLIRR